ncbi:MAG: phosphoadenylyl-sulfate reductase [Prevotella sp.]|nr:phosphoadenylyl-sulfate reductase [Prevotella sp.]
MERTQLIRDLNERFRDAPAEEVVGFFLEAYKGRIALSSSLSIEDQTLTDIIVRQDKTARIFTLDTGRLFPETYQLIDKTNLTYGIQLEVFFPDYREVQRMVREEGINLFYNSIERRHRCCQIRKLEPLSRAFQGLDAWICGLRREQSVTRQDMQVVEWDEMHGLIKVNPLISWTEQQVWDYVHEHHVPYNKLHDKGYPSIGCEPCTRAVQPGEDVRAGRWWWESPDRRECGLHQRH